LVSLETVRIVAFCVESVETSLVRCEGCRGGDRGDGSHIYGDIVMNPPGVVHLIKQLVDVPHDELGPPPVIRSLEDVCNNLFRL